MDIFNAAKKVSFFFLFLSFGLTQASFFGEKNRDENVVVKYKIEKINQELRNYKCESNSIESFKFGVDSHGYDDFYIGCFERLKKSRINSFKLNVLFNSPLVRLCKKDLDRQLWNLYLNGKDRIKKAGGFNESLFSLALIRSAYQSIYNVKKKL